MNQSNNGSYRKLRRTVTLGVCGILLLFALFIVYVVRNERINRLHALATHTSAATSVNEVLLYRVLVDIDRFLLKTRLLLKQGKADESLPGSLQSELSANPELIDLLIVDRDGAVIHWTGSGDKPVILGHPSYTYHLNRSEDHLFVSSPMSSSISEGGYEVSLSRPYFDDEQHFAGTVVAVVSIDRLAEVFAGIERAPGSTLVVTNNDNEVWFRNPRVPGDSGTRLPEALEPYQDKRQRSGRVTSPFDGKAYWVVEKRMADFPLRILTSAEMTSVMAVERAMIAWAIALFLVVSSVLFVLLYLIRRQMADLERGENALQKSHDLLTKLSEQVPGVIYQFRLFPDGRSCYPFASCGIEDIYEVTPEQVREDAALTIARIHPEDRNNVMSSVWESAAEMTAWHQEYRVILPKQGLRWLRGDSRPERLEDSSVLWHGFITDITERKLYELAAQELNRDFNTFLDNTSDYVYFKDQESRIRFCSKTLATVTGYDNWRELVGKHDSEIFPKDIARIYYEEEKPIFKDGKPLINKIDPYYDLHGQLRWVNTNKWPVFDCDGKTVVGLFGISRDVTEQKRIEEELLRSNVDLEQFAYSVSHDMRQPLRMITGHLQLLERALRDTLDEESRTNMAFALDGARRMDAMIVSLLDYSRVGRKTEPKTWLESKEALDEAMRFLQPDIVGTQAEIDVRGEWPTVFASRDELSRLFQNLIGNALKYREADIQPRIEISSDADSANWRVSIRDNGIGIDPTQIDRLFQFFSRLQLRSRYEGTGMGLALCRRIVEHHKGNIRAESQGEGCGSTFSFELPLSKPPQQHAEEPLYE
ncbi:MAG: PAS domain S-box protein [Methylomicrobium sp.]|nr:PAS domain S-box protein [Methylomicrobium sp.]